MKIFDMFGFRIFFSFCVCLCYIIVGMCPFSAFGPFSSFAAAPSLLMDLGSALVAL